MSVLKWQAPVKSQVTRTDNFLRADSGTLGGSWVEVEGTGATFNILSNQLKIQADTSAGPQYVGFAYWDESFNADQRASLVYKSESFTPHNCMVGPAVRINVAGTYNLASFYCLGYRPVATKRLELVKFNAQNPQSTNGTVLAGMNQNLAANDIIEVRAAGTAISGYLNGALVLGPITDTALTTGKPGIMASTVVGEFMITNWDDFSCFPAEVFPWAYFLSTELNSLANAASVLSAAFDNSVLVNRWMDIELIATFGSAPSAGGFVSVYLLPSLDGSAFSDGSTSILPASTCLVGVFPVRAVTTIQRILIKQVPLLPQFFKILVKNESGQAMAASGNALRYITYNEEIA